MNWFRPRLKVLPPAQRELWPQLRETPSQFVLYGGTALALRLGHRFSEDFDFFSSQALDIDRLVRTMSCLSGAEVTDSADQTIEFDVKGVKMSFFGSLTFGRTGVPQRAGKHGPALASLLDLSATKLKVIAQRAQVKDYVDVSAILKAGIPLETGLGAALTVYGKTFNPLPTLKALGYFEDGDLQSLPARVKKQLAMAASRIGELETVPRISRHLHADD